MPYSFINRVVILGHLTHDPELRELSSGRNVCHIRVACNGRRRNEQGEYESKPNYFDVSVFGPQGETVHRFLHKGRPVAVDGRLDWSEWETADGQRRQSVAIIASEVQFLRGAENATLEGAAGDEIEAAQDDVLAAKVGTEPEPVL
jgi:single-strand DNA-binding protein